jgi:ubiquinone biosynthesis protein
VVRQFTLSLRRELDFSAEGRSAERIAANFSAHPEIIVPRIHWPWTCERLNVQDYIEGIHGRDLYAVESAGLDRKQLARRGAQAVLKMMLEDGFFHADPHPGNVIYLPDNRIAFIDFGMVGRLSEERRYQLAVLLHGLVSHDAEKVAEVLLDWSGGAQIDSETLQPEIDAFVDQYHGVPLKNLDLGAMLSDLVAILREHGLVLPPDLALLIKAFITLEGLGRQLDPDFEMAGEAAPFLEQVLLAHAAPGALVRRGWRSLGSALALVAGLPQDLRQLLRAARRGKLHVEVDVLPLKQFGERLDNAASRLALAIVTAALIIGSAIVMTVEREPALPGLPSFGLLGFIAAVIGGLWVLLSIWRGGGRN